MRVKCRWDGELPFGRRIFSAVRGSHPAAKFEVFSSFSPILAGKEGHFLFMELENKKYASSLSKKYWKEAARQFSDVRMLTIAALIVALRIVVKFAKIPIAQGLSISLDAYVNSIGSVIYGPLVGLAVGLISDTVGCLVTGRMAEYFPPFALVEMMSSFLFGLFFWKRKIGISRALAAKFCVNLICNITLTSVFNKWMYFIYYGLERAEAYNIINGVRIVKNLIMFPLEATIIVIVLATTLPMLTKLKVVDKNYCFVDKPSNKKLLLQIALFTALSVAIILIYVFFLKDLVADLNIKLL